jgi:hypothetical protein
MLEEHSLAQRLAIRTALAAASLLFTRCATRAAAAPPDVRLQASSQPASSQPPTPQHTSPLSPNFEPVLVDPTVPPEEIHDDADTFVTADGEAMVKFVAGRVGQENLGEQNRTLLRTRGPRGSTALSRLWFTKVKKTAFVLRSEREARALVVDRAPNDNLVPPLPWMSLVLYVEGPSPTELGDWYRELARRVATAGRATGIVLFANGNAMAVGLEVQPVPGDDADIQIVARTRFMRAGSFTPDAWGPQIGGAGKVGTNKMNGHAGVSVRDILAGGRTAPTPPAGAPTLSL